MKIKVEIKKGRELSEREMNMMNFYRVKEFGREQAVDFKEDYPLITEYFFVKEDDVIVAFGLLRPIKIKYLKKSYNILGFGSGIAIKKGKGYGRLLMAVRIAHIKKKRKTGLGFCHRKNFEMFKSFGLKGEKNFIRRFRYKDSKTGEIEIDNNGDGIYCEGKDGFVEKVLSTKSIVYIDIPFW